MEHSTKILPAVYFKNLKSRRPTSETRRVDSTDIPSIRFALIAESRGEEDVDELQGDVKWRGESFEHLVDFRHLLVCLFEDTPSQIDDTDVD